MLLGFGLWTLGDVGSLVLFATSPTTVVLSNGFIILFLGFVVGLVNGSKKVLDIRLIMWYTEIVQWRRLSVER